MSKTSVGECGGGVAATYRIPNYCVGNLTDAGDGFALLKQLDHLGEAHGVGRLVAACSSSLCSSGAGAGSFLLDVQISLGGGLLPVQGRLL